MARPDTVYLYSMSIKGRGTDQNPANRYAASRSESVDDGWWQDETPQPSATRVLDEKVRTIITTNTSPDIPFDQSINPYRGCEHGCIYCYARPSHAYWDLSPGLDFETKIITKRTGPQLLEAALERRGYVCKPIAIGANTDPYQPVESSERITRGVLEVLQRHQHPFSLITKSALILRDLDIIAPMAEQGLCSVAVSVTTLDNALKRKLEPRTASPSARLRTIRALSDAGVPVTMMVAPVIPFINDREIEDILAAGREAGALSANYIFLRLPLEVAPLFESWLEAHFPDRAAHVMSLVRQSRDGRDYDPAFFERMRGNGRFAELISQRFRVAARRLGLESRGTDERFELDTSQFVQSHQQLALF